MKLASFDYPYELDTYLDQCLALIHQNLHFKHPLSKQIKAHFFSKRGKQLRSLLVLMCAKTKGIPFNTESVKAAAAVELLHNASLIHDDVLDQATQRRGLKTVSAKWDNKTAILFGDILLSESYHLCHQLSNPKILKSLAHATKEVCEGEILQNHYAFQLPILTLPKYYKIIGKKTASLFMSASEIGALAGQFNSGDVENLKQFGWHFGLAFQIFDDCLDLKLSAHLSGKSSFRDLSEGKITLPILHLLKCLPKSQQNWLLQHVYSLNTLEKKKVQSLLKEYQSIEYCQVIVIKHLKKATHHLNSVTRLEYASILQYWLKSLSGFSNI